MTLPGPSVPGRQFLDRHSNPNPNPNPIPNPVQELTVQELTVQEVSCNWRSRNWRSRNWRDTQIYRYYCSYVQHSMKLCVQNVIDHLWHFEHIISDPYLLIHCTTFAALRCDLMAIYPTDTITRRSPGVKISEFINWSFLTSFSQKASKP